ncbi:hypothetical protein DF19_07320 [Streptomyces olindensis]|nr:hypothetical protein DF19_07320 [Streptomyces olindensis]
MPLPDKGPYLMRFSPAAPPPGDDVAERPAGRAWLSALTPRGQTGATQLTRARDYARTAPVTQLVLEPGTLLHRYPGVEPHRHAAPPWGRIIDRTEIVRRGRIVTTGRSPWNASTR